MATKHVINLRWMPGTYSICRLPPTAVMPAARLASTGEDTFVGVIKCRNELSLLIPSSGVEEEWRAAEAADKDGPTKVDGGWVALEVQGPMPFDLVGSMSQLLFALMRSDCSDDSSGM